MYRSLLLIIAIMGPMLCLPSQAAGERLPVWQVRGEHSEMVLLGSIHMAYAETYPLRLKISNAFAAADTLVVEVDIAGDRAVEIQQMLAQRGQLPPDETLQQHLSPSTITLLDHYLESRGLSPVMFNTLHPGLLVMILSSMRMVELGMRSEFGIDQHFLALARPDKAIVELETPEQQIDLLLSFPDNDLLLSQTLLELEDLEKFLDPLYRAWSEGDEVALQRLIMADELLRNPQFQPIFDKMFGQRNIQMTAKITALLAGQGRYFVVVGAGHLVGETGIVSLLRKKGYRVQRL